MEHLIQALNAADHHHAMTVIRGGQVENLYERDIAEKAEIDLLVKIAKSGVETFSLGWCVVDRQWQVFAIVDGPSNTEGDHV